MVKPVYRAATNFKLSIDKNFNGAYDKCIEHKTTSRLNEFILKGYKCFDRMCFQMGEGGEFTNRWTQ
jgi:hypothetical protein